MDSSLENTEVIIEYKNDETATNKLMDFIIDFLLENTNTVGENNE